MTEKSTRKLSPDFGEALRFAAILHSGQTRKGKPTPYIAHLLAVASIVIENGGSEDEAIAALLHDSLEDQGAAHGGSDTLAGRIRRQFGDEVLEIVQGCTDSDTEPRPEWEDRKTSFIARLRTAPESVCLVVAADKLHNVRTIRRDLQIRGREAWEIFTAPRERTMWYYATVSGILSERLVQRGKHLASDLAEAIAEVQRLAGES